MEEFATEFLSKNPSDRTNCRLRIIDNLELTATEFIASLKYSTIEGGDVEADINIQETDTDNRLYYERLDGPSEKAERCAAIALGIDRMSNSNSINCITFTVIDNDDLWLQVTPTAIDDQGNIVLGNLNLAYRYMTTPNIEYPEFANDVSLLDWEPGSYATLSIGSYSRQSLAIWIDNFLSNSLGLRVGYNIGFEALVI